MNVIITGSTGMVGKGVLLECLEDIRVKKVLVLNRNPIDIQHTKLTEVLVKDFNDFESIKEQLNNYDACFFCLGISSVGMKEKDFAEITVNITVNLAKVLFEINPEMVFNYVSGTGTDSTEKGRIMWARVKGKTENIILNMGFKDAYAFRPGLILPERGIKSRTKLYRAVYIIMRPIFPLLRKMKTITTTSRVGKAMINSVLYPQNLKHLENKDINKLTNVKQ